MEETKIYNCKCFTCGKELYRKPSRIKKYKNQFCGVPCQRLEIKKKSKSEIKTCSFCGSLTRKTQNQLRQSKSGLVFCNNICKNTYISRNCAHGIRTPYNHFKRKKRILELCKNTCQKCGYSENSKMLDIHHNNGQHRDNSWDNLRCVCVWCHLLHHRCGENLDLPSIVDPDKMYDRV